MSKVAVVFGGAGNIGSACVKAILRTPNYKNVVITSRSQEKIDKTIEAVKTCVSPEAAKKIFGVVGNIGDEKSAAEMKEKVVAAVGEKIDTVISSLGFPYLNLGPMLYVTNDQMKGVFETQFYSNFVGYKTFMPLVKDNSDGSYVMVTGGGPDTYVGPGCGCMTLGASTSTALAKVVMKEHVADAVCCTEMSFRAGICPDPSLMDNPDLWLESARAGQALLSVATKRKADGKTLIVQSSEDMQQIIDNGIQN